jgi:hypothetical protein
MQDGEKSTGNKMFWIVVMGSVRTSGFNNMIGAVLKTEWV